MLVSVERLSVSIASLSDIAAQTSESWEQYIVLEEEKHKKPQIH